MSITITKDKDGKYIIKYGDNNITYNITYTFTGLNNTDKTHEDIKIFYKNEDGSFANLNNVQNKQILTKVLENKTFTDLQTEIGDNDNEFFWGRFIGQFKKTFRRTRRHGCGIKRKKKARRKKRERRKCKSDERSIRTRKKIKKFISI